MKNLQPTKDKDEYKYRPVLFFICAYFFTWIFWIPAIFVSETAGSMLMLVGLIALTGKGVGRGAAIMVFMSGVLLSVTALTLLRLSAIEELEKSDGGGVSG